MSEQRAEFACPRDRHWFGPGRKRVLSLDGGGVRGIVALAFLERMEALLAEAAGKPVRLCDHFDLIGGTSTGAIIATGLALGYSAQQMREFYFRLAPRVFRRTPRLLGWQAKFDARALRREIVEILGERTLGSPDLLTGLAIMLKRLDAGGAWVVSNNPRGEFWETSAGQRRIGNRHYELAALVRASTAAPSFFDPQPIEIVRGDPPFLFVDGGLTAHNDPSLALLMLVQLPAHGIGWPLGPESLSFVSLGTGTFRPYAEAEKLARASAATVAFTSLVQHIAESQQLTLTLMSWLGRGGAPWPINSEIGDLRQVETLPGPLFRYQRYDIRLESEWLSETLGQRFTDRELADFRRFDKPDVVAPLYEVAQRAAERLMNAADVAAA